MSSGFGHSVGVRPLVVRHLGSLVESHWKHFKAEATAKSPKMATRRKEMCWDDMLLGWTSIECELAVVWVEVAIRQPISVQRGWFRSSDNQLRRACFLIGQNGLLWAKLIKCYRLVLTENVGRGKQGTLVLSKSGRVIFSAFVICHWIRLQQRI